MNDGAIVLAVMLGLSGVLAWAMVAMARTLRMPVVIGPPGGTHVLDDLAKGQLNALIDRMRTDIVTVRTEMASYQRELEKCRQGEVQTSQRIADLGAQVQALRTEIERLGHRPV